MPEDQIEKDSGLPTPESKDRWNMFYPGIENNMVFVHGTPTLQKRDQILESGLEPPKDAASSDTLARNVQYSTFERYSGFDGYILVYRLNEEDIKGGGRYKNQSRTFSIGDKGVINSDKILVIIPKKQSQIYNHLQKDYRLAIEQSEFSDNNQALEKISEISREYVGKVSDNLTEHGDFVNGELTKEQVDKLSQELVWNQLMDNLKGTVINLEFYSRELTECGTENYADFESMLERITNEKKNWEYVRRSIDIVKSLENQEGSGLDKVPLTQGVNFEIVEDFIDWEKEKEQTELETRKQAEKVASMSKFQRLLHRLRPKQQSK